MNETDDDHEKMLQLQLLDLNGYFTTSVLHRTVRKDDLQVCESLQTLWTALSTECWCSHRIIPSGCCCSSSCSQSSCWWWPVEREIWLGTLMGTVWGELKIFQEQKYFTNKILHPGTTSMILMMITTAYSIYTTMMTMETVVHRVAFLFLE